jgi:hypothetical protein
MNIALIIILVVITVIGNAAARRRAGAPKALPPSNLALENVPVPQGGRGHGR